MKSENSQKKSVLLEFRSLKFHFCLYTVVDIKCFFNDLTVFNVKLTLPPR
jgi:hypothetical protein